MAELVSVLVPLFGRHRGRDTLAAVGAAWARQDVPCEVVVAVTGDALPVPAPGSVRVVRADPDPAAPGVLRNIAAARATGDWLYLSDADVRPVGTDYLARALRLAGTGALAQPWMYRLVGAGPAGFGAPERDDELRRLSGIRCCFLQVPAELGAVRVCDDEGFVYEDDTLMVVPPAAMPVAADELRWRPPFHWGGMLVRRSVFDAVGGYFTGYAGWGCEDDDLLAKVGARTTVTVAWQADPSLRCAHFEHTRPYDNPGFAANRARLAQRLADGVEAMIEADLSTGLAWNGE